jgi:NDP-sugar pyrophosphorylase family protein
MGIFNIILRNYHDFQDGRGRVKARRHKNGGGWVADTAFISSSDTYIDKNANVYDFAVIDGKSKIFGKVNISGKTYIDASTIRNNVYSKHFSLIIKNNVSIGKSEINVNQLYFDSAISLTADITDKV